MTLTMGPGEREPIDDYHVDRGVGEATKPVTHHVLTVVNAVLLIVLAALSFALFWIVATLLGIA